MDSIDITKVARGFEAPKKGMKRTALAFFLRLQSVKSFLITNRSHKSTHLPMK